MLYWDTSALFSFFVSEKSSTGLRSFVESMPASSAYTSIITPLEFESAVLRRINEKSLTAREADQIRIFGIQFRRNAFLVPLDLNLLDTALHLQKIYRLRPGDAIQLASARMATDNPAKVVFICLDEKLNEAANREGFQCFTETK